ncbi:MAG: C4-dicarboxylate ABC transporter [Gammaproteobacteria bacterium]|nr:C4-dicarboxylate ABC transporter [Gammaproteobacteria bacterium]
MKSTTNTSTRLENFPVSFFAMVMGLTGLTVGWEKAQHILGVDLHINTLLVGLAVCVFVGLALIYSTKLIRYRQSVLQELRHPVKLIFFPSISISMLLLSICFMPINMAITHPLWLIGTALHLMFTLYVVGVWMHHEHFEIHHMNPAWFIPAVGNVLVPVAGMQLGYSEVSWFFFSIGMLFWIVLMTILFNRVLFHNPIEQRLLSTLFILIAPPAVGFIAYMRLTGELDAFARILYYGGLFLTLLLFTQVRRFLKLEFFLSWWAYSFPLAAISIASMVMFEQTKMPLYLWIGGGLLLLLTGIVSLLLTRTVIAVKRQGICLPGH